MHLPLFVLAGGFGTRLQSVLNGLPKALAPINGKPFLYLQIKNWISQGCNSFVFLLHHEANQIIDFLAFEEQKLLKGCCVQYIVEPMPLDTGGAVAYAAKQLRLDGDFLLTNADTWLSSGFREMMLAHSPVILVVKVEDVGRYGEVLINGQNLITKFSEKNSKTTRGWINAGASRLSTGLFKDWDHQPFSLERITYPRLVLQKDLFAITIDAEFIDIGIPSEYERFVLRNRIR